MGAEEEKGWIDRVTRIVPHQRRQDAETQHHDPDDDAPESHFDAPDVKRLIGVSRMEKTPDKSRKDQTRRPRAQDFPQKRDGKGAELHLFGYSGQKSAEQDPDPGNPRVEQVGIVDVSGRPRTQLVGREVKNCLVREKEKRQGEPDHIGHEERTRAKALPAHISPDGDEPAEILAIDRLGTADEEKHPGPRAKRGEDAPLKVSRNKAGVRVGGPVGKLGYGEIVQLSQKV